MTPENQPDLDDERPSDSAEKPNPFLKFAFSSPRRSETSSSSSSSSSPRGFTTPENIDKLGKRKAPECMDDPFLDADHFETPESPSKGRSTSAGSPSSLKGSNKRVRTYSHLKPLKDNLAPGLDIMFCGINPGQQSALIGHHFGNPRNHFWSCLHESGLTSRKLDPREDFKLPEEFSIGITNLVERPTAEQSELSRKEQVDGVPQLLDKIAQYQPRIVCFVGLGIADIFRANVTEKKATKTKTAIGLQNYKMIHSRNSNYTFPVTKSPDVETLFYVVSSTSGRVVKYQKVDKIQQFKDLRALVEQLKSGDILTAELEIINNDINRSSLEATS